MASSWLNFFERKKTKTNSKKLSQLRHVELANECESKKTNIICIGRDGGGTPSWLKGM